MVLTTVPPVTPFTFVDVSHQCFLCFCHTKDNCNMMKGVILPSHLAHFDWKKPWSFPYNLHNWSVQLEPEGKMRAVQSRSKPLWLNYAQWLLGPTGGWQGHEAWWKLACLFFASDWVQLSFVTMSLQVNRSHPPLESACWTGKPSCGKYLLLELLAFCVWMFPVGQHSLHVWEKLMCVRSSFFPSAFSVLLCLLVFGSQTR